MFLPPLHQAVPIQGKVDILRFPVKSILGNSLLLFAWKTSSFLRDITTALQGIHIKYALHHLAGPGDEQFTFLSLLHSASFYTRKSVTLACVWQRAGERTSWERKEVWGDELSSCPGTQRGKPCGNELWRPSQQGYLSGPFCPPNSFRI